MFQALLPRPIHPTEGQHLLKALYFVPHTAAQIDEFSTELTNRKGYSAKFVGFLFATDVHLGVQVPVMVNVGEDPRDITPMKLFVHAWVAYAGLAHVVDMGECSRTVVVHHGEALESHFTIFFTPQNVAEPKNTGAVTNGGKISFKGNILVVKHSSEDDMPLDVNTIDEARITIIVREQLERGLLN